MRHKFVIQKCHCLRNRLLNIFSEAVMTAVSYQANWAAAVVPGRMKKKTGMRSFETTDI